MDISLRLFKVVLMENLIRDIFLPMLNNLIINLFHLIQDIDLSLTLFKDKNLSFI